MYRRPLFAASIGFVLGEVCALQAESGEWKIMDFLVGTRSLRQLAFILSAVLIAALLAVVATAGKVVNKAALRKREIKNRRKTGKGRGMHEWLWILLLLCVFCAGYGRMAWEIREWEEIEERLWENGEVVCLSGKVEDIREKERTIALTVKTEEMGKVFVSVEREGAGNREGNLPEMERKILEDLPIGCAVEVRGEVNRFGEARNPGQFDRRAYYRSQGISAAVFAWEVSWDAKKGRDDGSPYLDALYRIRRFCSNRLQRICEPEDQGIFRAALLGEKEGMDQEIKDLYQKNGIAHLLAISGLHLSLLGAGLHHLLRRCGLGYGLSGGLAAAGIFSYGLLTGASGSTMRAVIMLLVSFLAAYMGRTYDGLSALSLAALLLAGKQPFSIVQSGFQLSFGAVLGIGIVGRSIEKGLELKQGWRKGLAVSVAIQLATGPVVLWHYFQIPVYGVFLNLAVIPLMGYVVISGLLGLGAGTVSYWGGVMAVGTGHYILRFYQKLCEIISAFPGYLLVWGRPGAGQLVFYYLFLGGMVIGLNREATRRKEAAGKEKEEGRKQEEGRRGIRYQSLGILAGGIIFCMLSLRPRPQHGLDIAVLDVGQGDGIVLLCEGGESKSGGIIWLDEERRERHRETVILIDGGSTSDKQVGKNRLEPYLKSQGISRIDVAVVSHGDEDHISGLRYLLTDCPEIRIGCLLLPEAGAEDKGYDRLLEEANKRGVRTGYMDAGDWIQAGACRLTCFYPGKEMEADFSDRNQQSLVLRADYEDFHMLFTGDVSQEGERMALDYGGEEAFSSIQVLKAAHHGSRFSNGKELLAAVHPAWTVISYEEGNSYGHPHGETLERLREEGSLVLETGKMGAVLIHVENGRARYRGYR